MTVLTVDQLRLFGRDGYLVVSGVVEESVLAGVDEEIDRLLPTCPPNMDGSADAHGGTPGRHGWSIDAHLLPRCEEVLCGAVLPVAEQLVAPLSLDHRFGQTQIATTVPPYPHVPGGPHVDNHKPGDHVQESFTVLAGVLLTDQSAPQMGNLWVWPGSHRDHARLFRERGTAALRDVWGHVGLLDPPFPIGPAREVMAAR